MSTPLEAIQVSLEQKGFKEDRIENYIDPKVIAMTQKLIESTTPIPIATPELRQCVEYIDFSMADDWWPKLIPHFNLLNLGALHEHPHVAEKMLPLLDYKLAKHSRHFSQKEWLRSRLHHKLSIVPRYVFDQYLVLRGNCNHVYQIDNDFILDEKTFSPRLLNSHLSICTNYSVYQILVSHGADITTDDRILSKILFYDFPVDLASNVQIRKGQIPKIFEFQHLELIRWLVESDKIKISEIDVLVKDSYLRESEVIQLLLNAGFNPELLIKHQLDKLKNLFGNFIDLNHYLKS